MWMFLTSLSGIAPDVKGVTLSYHQTVMPLQPTSTHSTRFPLMPAHTRGAAAAIDVVVKMFFMVFWL